MLHEPVKALKPLPMLELPKIPGKEQTLQEWHAAGGSVPMQYKSKPHVWHAKVKKYAEGGSVGDDTYGNAPDNSDGGLIQDSQHFATGGAVRMADGGAAFGKYPAMKPSTSKGKKEAQYRLPLDVARGAVAGVLGMPGDLETLGRLGVNLAFGPGGVDVSNESFLPTSEDVEKRIPFRGTEPVNELGAGFGSLIGGLSPAPAKAAIQGAKAVGRGALDLAKSDAAHRVVQKALSSPMMAPSRQMNVVKEPGGNWLSGAGSPEQALESLKRPDRATGNRRDPKESMAEMKATYTPEVLAMLSPETKAHVAAATHDLEKKIAMNDWVDRNLTNYVKKQMGTVDDPVRKLAEEGIVHIPTNEVGINRYRAPERRGYQSDKQLGKSEAAKAWEDATDVLIGSDPASSLTKPLTEYEIERGYKSVADTNPWLSKVAPDTPIHSISMMGRPVAIELNLGFDHILDVLREDVAAGRIRPEQLNKVSMEQAVRRTYEYDQEMARKMRETQAKVTEGMPVHKEYPEGYKWIELNKPKNLPEGWSEEAKGLRDPATGGITNIDPREEALRQALKYEGDTMGHCVGGYCPDVEAGRSRIYSLRDAKGEPHVTVEVEPDIRPRESYYGEPADKIVQIKGKQNRAPKEEYLPYVQDFVKSGNWSGVGDPQNAGLRRYGDVFDVNEQRAIEATGQTVPSHEYLTGEDIQRMHNAIVPEGKRLKYNAKGSIIASEPGYKAGGEVHMQAGGLSKFVKLIAKEAPVQAKTIREALGQAFTKNLEHSVVGSADRGYAGSIVSGDWDSVKPNQLDILRAVKSNRPIVDFHTHPQSGQAAFDVAPSGGDFHFASNEYFPGKENRELRTLIASPANAVDRVPSSYSFFATDNPSKVFDRRALDNAIFELQRAGKKGLLKSIMDDPRFREYFDAGGSLGDLAENIAPLSLLNLREAQGLGRGQLELSGRRLAPENPESTNKNLFDVMNPLAVEFFSRKGFAEGGKVKNPGTKLKNSKSCDCHD